MKQSPNQEFEPATSGQIDRMLRLATEILKSEEVHGYFPHEHGEKRWMRHSFDFLNEGTLPFELSQRLGDASDELDAIMEGHGICVHLETTERGRTLTEGYVGQISLRTTYTVGTSVSTEAEYSINTSTGWSNPTIEVKTGTLQAGDSPYTTAFTERLKRRQQEITESKPGVASGEAQCLLNLLQMATLAPEITNFDRY